jgi:hypothetical protein
MFWRGTTFGTQTLELRSQSVAVIYTDRLNLSNHQKSSSKAQIAAYLLMILAVAERGGLKSQLVSGR